MFGPESLPRPIVCLLIVAVFAVCIPTDAYAEGEESIIRKLWHLGGRVLHILDAYHVVKWGYETIVEAREEERRRQEEEKRRREALDRKVWEAYRLENTGRYCTASKLHDEILRENPNQTYSREARDRLALKINKLGGLFYSLSCTLGENPDK